MPSEEAKERKREAMKEYYEKNKEQRKAANKAYYEANKEKWNQYRKESRQRAKQLQEAGKAALAPAPEPAPAPVATFNQEATLKLIEMIGAHGRTLPPEVLQTMLGNLKTALAPLQN